MKGLPHTQFEEHGLDFGDNGDPILRCQTTCRIRFAYERYPCKEAAGRVGGGDEKALFTGGQQRSR